MLRAPLRENSGLLRGRSPLKLIPALTTCASKRIKTEGFCTLRVLPPGSGTREAKHEKTRRSGLKATSAKLCCYYFLLLSPRRTPLKYSRVSLMTMGDNPNRPTRFGIAMKPLRVSGDIPYQGKLGDGAQDYHEAEYDLIGLDDLGGLEQELRAAGTVQAPGQYGGGCERGRGRDGDV